MAQTDNNNYRVHNGKCTRWNKDLEDWERFYKIEERLLVPRFNSLPGFTYFAAMVCLAVAIANFNIYLTIASMFGLLGFCWVFVWSFTALVPAWVVERDFDFKSKEAADRYVKGLSEE